MNYQNVYAYELMIWKNLNLSVKYFATVCHTRQFIYSYFCTEQITRNSYEEVFSIIFDVRRVSDQRSGDYQ